MKTKLDSLTLRWRIVLLILLASVPTVIILVADNVRAQREAYRREVQRLVDMADAIADDEERFLRSAEDLLISVAHAAQREWPHPDACNAYLESLRRKLPAYANLIVADAGGHIRCAAVRSNGVDLSDRAYFRTAQSVDRLVASDFLISKTTGKRSVVFARAIRDNNRLHSVAVAALDIDALQAMVANIKRPRTTSLAITDRNGVVLAADAAMSGAVGAAFPYEAVLRSIRTARNTDIEDIGKDGAARLFAVAPIGPSREAPFFVVLGMPKADIAGELRGTLLLNLALFGAVFSILMFAVWRMGERLLLDPVRVLTEVIGRVAAGETRTRSGLDYRAGEIGALAYHFDEMASALERRAEQARESLERIEFLAHHDHVTGLPNEVLLMIRLEERIQAATVRGDALAVLFIDLDRFRSVNESFDRAGGDSILFDTAKRLTALAGADDIVARLSADEFVCVTGGRRHTELADLAMRILYAIQEPFIMDGKPVNLGARIGIALFPADGGNAATLVKHADTAKRRAKAGRQKIEFFNHDLDAAALRGWSLENELRAAIDHGQLMLHYQPKVDLRSGRTVGAEALIRWQHPVRGLVPPVEFISVAERSRLIIPIGDWVILEACRQGARWLEAGLPPLNIAVNVSAEQFLHGDVEGAVRAALQSTGFPAESFELEITEGVLLRDVDRDLARLRNLNVKISVDDFGTGYSCLSYLKNLKVDKLKVDQSFVRHLTDNASDQAITGAILDMAKSLGLYVVAEGIETAEAEALLKEMGCDQGQGYLYARPLPAAEFEIFLREENAQKR